VELVPASAPRRDTRYVVRVGELAVEVAGDFEEGVLVRLVQALRSC
jgi:hypothetical protein